MKKIKKLFYSLRNKVTINKNRYFYVAYNVLFDDFDKRTISFRSCSVVTDYNKYINETEIENWIKDLPEFKWKKMWESF